MTYEGKIIGSDEKSVYLGAFGSAKPIERSEIYRIRHPGLTRGIIWSAVAAYGVLNILVGVPTIADQPAGAYRTGYTIGIFLPAALGVPLAIEGFATMSRSIRALNTPYSPSE